MRLKMPSSGPRKLPEFHDAVHVIAGLVGVDSNDVDGARQEVSCCRAQAKALVGVEWANAVGDVHNADAGVVWMMAAFKAAVQASRNPRSR